jgi:hypothetical protein
MTLRPLVIAHPSGSSIVGLLSASTNPPKTHPKRLCGTARYLWEFREKGLTGGKWQVTFLPYHSASSLFRPRRFASANGGVFN